MVIRPKVWSRVGSPILATSTKRVRLAFASSPEEQHPFPSKDALSTTIAALNKPAFVIFVFRVRGGALATPSVTPTRLAWRARVNLFLPQIRLAVVTGATWTPNVLFTKRAPTTIAYVARLVSA